MNNIYIIVGFIVAASLGIYMLTLVLKEKKRPILIVGIHGVIALATYAVLTYLVGVEAHTTSQYTIEAYAFVAFSFAAIGGLYMVIRDKLLKQGIPKWIPFIHGGLALTGLIILIIATVLNG